MKKALLSGVTGQVGSYLAEELLNKGYEVHGIIRRSSNFNTQRIDHIFNNLNLHYGDILDYVSVSSLVNKVKPDYVYHLACQSHVAVSFDLPNYTFRSTAEGTLNFLESIRHGHPTARFLHSGSSEQFGSSPPPQNESTLQSPASPYAVGKVAASSMVKLYREAYGLFACSSICFNMESPRRGSTFVTKKIVEAAVKIKLGKSKELRLGNINSERSWQHARDGVSGMMLMMEADQPKDYVICATEMHSVKEFLEMVFNKLALNYKDYVVIDPKYFRPKEVPALEGDSSLIRNELGWSPKFSFEDLVDEMIAEELKSHA